MDTNSPDLKDKLAKALSSLGYAKMPGRIKATLMRGLILQLCENNTLSLKELSLLLEREPKAMQDQYLTHMVAQGLLVLKYPYNKNHPDQSYRKR